MQIDLNVLSSDGDSSYVVEFVFDEGSLTVHCECPAGEFGKSCRHKLGLLQGDFSILANSDEKPLLDNVRQWVEKSKLNELLATLRSAEAAEKAAKASLAVAKKRLEKAMSGDE